MSDNGIAFLSRLIKAFPIQETLKYTGQFSGANFFCIKKLSNFLKDVFVNNSLTTAIVQ